MIYLPCQTDYLNGAGDGEYHIIGRDGITVMEIDVIAEFEGINSSVIIYVKIQIRTGEVLAVPGHVLTSAE